MSITFREFHYYMFSMQYDLLLLRVLALRQKNPDEYMHNDTAKFFARVRRAMDVCLTCPDHKDYCCGKTLETQRYKNKQLGEGYSHWRRIKKDMPDRYRLFFQYSSQETKVIFGWLNDRRTLRKDNSKSDVYAVFAKMLASRRIPNQFNQLAEESVEYSK